MDENAVDARPAATPSDAVVMAIDSIDVIPFSSVVTRLAAEYPRVPTARIEGILLREWEAFSAGRPLVVPLAVEAGVREILDQR